MPIRIGELSRLAGCPIVTIRYYEKEGLLSRPERNSSNYRVYHQSDLERLRFILHCRKHGMSLNDIRRLLYLRDNPQSECAFVHELIARQLVHVEEQIASLNNLKQELLLLQSENKCYKSGRCSILDKLQAPDNCQYCKGIRGN